MDALFKKIKESGIGWALVLVFFAAYNLGSVLSGFSNRQDKTDANTALNAKAIADANAASAKATEAQTKALESLTGQFTSFQKDFAANTLDQAKQLVYLRDKANEFSQRLDRIEQSKK